MMQPYEIGKIFTLELPDEWDGWDRDILLTHKDIMPKFPHLFQPLEWWEERHETEMPEYVKGKKGEKVFKLLDATQNGRRWHNNEEMELSHLLRHGSHYLPATKEEFESQSK